MTVLALEQGSCSAECTGTARWQKLLAKTSPAATSTPVGPPPTTTKVSSLPFSCTLQASAHSWRLPMVLWLITRILIKV